MQTLVEKVFMLGPPGGLFTDTVVVNLFPEASPGARKQLVHKALKAGEVMRLKRGVYLLAPEYRKSEPHPFAIAALLYTQSHISLDSALSYHGLIPEAVFQVSSVTALRSRTFETPIAIFTYDCVPTNDLRAGVETVRIDRLFWAFIATPLRAIADMLYLHREVTWQNQGMTFLTESLRIEEEDLAAVSFSRYPEVRESIRDRRTLDFIKNLRKTLQ